VLDFEDVDGDSAAIASAGPLGILWDVRRERDEILKRKGKVPVGEFLRSDLGLLSRIAGLIDLPCANPQCL
jgi:hypothetical protein